jgi:hypothetical protein
VINKQQQQQKQQQKLMTTLAMLAAAVAHSDVPDSEKAKPTFEHTNRGSYFNVTDTFFR